MRFLRYFVLTFGLMVLLTGTVLAVGHQQSTEGLWKIVFTNHAQHGWEYVEVLPTGVAIEKPTSLTGSLLWSPNNEWVLFTAPSGMAEALYVARSDGSQRRILLDGATNIFSVAWSPDSAWIYYSDEISPNNYDLFRMRIADRHVEAFGFQDTVNCCRWSADGEWMLVRALQSDGRQTIMRLRLDKSERSTVFSSNADIRFITIPEFAGQGDWIVFTGEYLGAESGIYRMRADGSDLQRIGSAVTTGLTPLSITADGEWMAFAVVARDNRPAQLVRLNIDGTQQDILLEADNLAEFGNLHKIWSPDGRYLLFYRRLAFSYQLTQLDMETGDIRSVYDGDLNDIATPHFLPVRPDEWNGWIVVGGCLVAIGLVLWIKG